MKKIIDGRRYDTDTADELASDSYLYPGDHAHYEEALYRTPRGAYFLAGSGGPMSKYGQSCGPNSWSDGDGIVPLTDSEALRWIERSGADVPECLSHLVQDA